MFIASILFFLSFFLSLLFCSLYQMFLFEFSYLNYYVKYVFSFATVFDTERNGSKNGQVWMAGNTCHFDYKLKNRRKFGQREWDQAKKKKTLNEDAIMAFGMSLQFTLRQCVNLLVCLETVDSHRIHNLYLTQSSKLRKSG